jgi:hypothetical protein
MARHGDSGTCIGLLTCGKAFVEKEEITYMDPVIALVTAGVEMDVLGIDYPEYGEATRAVITRQHPRGSSFKEDLLEEFYQGIRHKPEATFGKVKADVVADNDFTFMPGNFCRAIRKSAWTC